MQVEQFLKSRSSTFHNTETTSKSILNRIAANIQWMDTNYVPLSRFVFSNERASDASDLSLRLKYVKINLWNRWIFEHWFSPEINFSCNLSFGLSMGGVFLIDLGWICRNFIDAPIMMPFWNPKWNFNSGNEADFCNHISKKKK